YRRVRGGRSSRPGRTARARERAEAPGTPRRRRDPVGGMTTARSSTAKLRERLDAVRARRARLLAEQAETERRPITRDGAGARLAAYLDAIVAQGSRGVDLGAAAFAVTTVPPPMTSLVMPSVLEPAFGAWLVDLLRPVLEERLTVALDGMDWSRA